MGGSLRDYTIFRQKDGVVLRHFGHLMPCYVHKKSGIIPVKKSMMPLVVLIYDEPLLRRRLITWFGRDRRFAPFPLKLPRSLRICIPETTKSFLRAVLVKQLFRFIETLW